MSEPNPPRRPLATFLRPASEGEAAPATDARTPDPSAHDIPAAKSGDPVDAALPPMAETRQLDDTVILDEATVIEPVLAVPAAQAVAGGYSRHADPRPLFTTDVGTATRAILAAVER